MSEPFWSLAFLAFCACLAGGMNSIAGGGTLLTFPALLALVAPEVANATSTVALLPGSAAAALGYRGELYEARRFVRRMLLPSLLGGFVGAGLVLAKPEAFGKLVPWLILTAAVLFLIQQPISRYLRKHKPDHEPGPAGQLGLMFFQFLVAVYGGYFGAGIGILMLTALGFMGIANIHQANGVKTLLAAVINTASVVVFAVGGLVDWPLALLMAVAAIVGGYGGARIARRLPAWVVRWTVIAIGFALAVHYFLKPAE